MRPDIHKDLTRRLNDDYGLEQVGDYLRKGTCPKCSDKHVYARAENPWILRCNRPEKCGWERSVKDLYPEIFDTWGNRYPKTHADPTAAADAYLTQRRRFNLKGMKGAYSQETYADRKLNISTATVRFDIPRTDGAWWERLIDQPARFGKKKANFAYGKSYSGWVWHAPDQPYDKLAQAEEIWFVEGVFDAWAWREAGIYCVSPLSCGNYPVNFLAEIKRICSIMDRRLPRLVFAYDIGKAGIEGIRKHVARAQQQGWEASAALPREDSETEKLDWNDLHERDLLATNDPLTKAPWIETYRWYGRVLLAETATDKAYLIWERHRSGSFYFIHKNKTWWANFDAQKIAELAKSEDVTEEFAAGMCSSVTEIANCAFRILYSLKDADSPDLQYYLAIDMPNTDVTVRQTFAPAAMVSGSKFKEALFGKASGAQWLGSTRQLDIIVSKQQERGLNTVETLDFLGYSKRHQAWCLGDMLVHRGQVQGLNADDYFDIGKAQLKLRSNERPLAIKYDSDRFNTSWFPYLWAAWGGNGLVTLTFWVMSFFAEQLREIYGDLGYLEMHGPPGTGKSTIILFLWKMTGLAQRLYEGIDPSKSTMAGYVRALTRYANLPVIFVEADRDSANLHTKKFDWDEIKALFNGQTGRATGKKSQGTEINEALFRGALIIEQNRPINADPAILQRIVQTHWTKDGWTADTGAATEKIKAWPFEDVSGCMVHFIRREAEYLEVFQASYARWIDHMPKAGVRTERVQTNHAKMHAGLDALAHLIGISDDIVKKGHAFIDKIGRTRDQSLESDHPVVTEFWEKFDFIQSSGKALTAEGDPGKLDHSKNIDLHAINLVEFEAAVRRAGLQWNTTPDDLKKHLRTSKSRAFVDVKTVDSKLKQASAHCWVFRTEDATLMQKGR